MESREGCYRSNLKCDCPDFKEEATVVLASIGLTVSDAFRMMLMRVVAEQALPFDPLVSNAETIAAMRDADSATCGPLTPPMP